MGAKKVVHARMDEWVDRHPMGILRTGCQTKVHLFEFRTILSNLHLVGLRSKWLVEMSSGLFKDQGFMMNTKLYPVESK